ncbi:uncharacterized protein LOC115018768 [Cottoperca gobio]|uniref:Uncharacterized protein LOC115018768 n=1 Tax=Cottoperca gobio TaxID=56716 RepID=A0A6J2R141_COTGO|nr:uncharacterized protein LOC115018768 [Cottoperca gobio]
MTGVHNSLTWTRSDDIAEVLSAESCHIVLETSHPDNVEKISQYIESSVDDNVCDETAEAESDSEDSLFLTQKSVPEAVRPARQLYYSLRSKPISPRDLEESAEDNSSSASYDEESKSDNKRRRKKYTLPKFSFPFLTEQKCKLLPSQNKCLHTYLIGGFFESVRVGGPRQGEDPESSLPTVDLDGESISPLSEEDEERAEEEDIKVVERKRFVVSSKAKSQQTWCNPLKQQRTGKASMPNKTHHKEDKQICCIK